MGRYKQVMWFFIHMNFQDLQQKADWDTGWGAKNNGDGEDLES